MERLKGETLDLGNGKERVYLNGSQYVDLDPHKDVCFDGAGEYYVHVSYGNKYFYVFSGYSKYEWITEEEMEDLLKQVNPATLNMRTVKRDFPNFKTYIEVD